MNEKGSSFISYFWNSICGFFAGVGAISPDWWMVIISLVGMLVTAYINYHFQKKRLEREFGLEQD